MLLVITFVITNTALITDDSLVFEEKVVSQQILLVAGIMTFFTLKCFPMFDQSVLLQIHLVCSMKIALTAGHFTRVVSLTSTTFAAGDLHDPTHLFLVDPAVPLHTLVVIRLVAAGTASVSQGVPVHCQSVFPQQREIVRGIQALCASKHSTQNVHLSPSLPLFEIRSNVLSRVFWPVIKIVRFQFHNLCILADVCLHDMNIYEVFTVRLFITKTTFVSDNPHMLGQHVIFQSTSRSRVEFAFFALEVKIHHCLLGINFQSFTLNILMVILSVGICDIILIE